jgi:hypothetical protein
MGSFVSRAHESGSCLLVVTRSSNPEGRAIQSALDGSGQTVEGALLREIGELNAELTPGEIGPIGAVVGPNAHRAGTRPRGRTGPVPRTLTWRSQSIPRLGYLSGVSCANTSDCSIVGDTVLTTTNGGKK